ncbi:MAG: hypothetical protein G01um101444_253 [Parcubacteria group bacterium Gr01-1014_44]|nr:MAG: hypothetical protein G01um101444_253 [Parcubacteria group bacterium Gr01-1014_44]
MNVLEWIDAKILSFFTKISHKFQRLTGRTNFFLANICLTVLAMQVVLRIVNYWFPVITQETTGFDLLFSFLLACFISSDKKVQKKLMK